MSTAVDRGFETWRCNLLAHRYNELGAACRADRELYSEDMSHGREIDGVTIIDPFR